MSTLISADTANFIKGLKNTSNLRRRNRREKLQGGGTGAPGNVKVCEISGGDALTGYSATAYPSMTALRENTGGTGVTIYPVEIGLNSYLPQGTIVLCHESLCRVTGGSENTHDDEVETEEEEEQQQGGN